MYIRSYILTSKLLSYKGNKNVSSFNSVAIPHAKILNI